MSKDIRLLVMHKAYELSVLFSKICVLIYINCFMDKNFDLSEFKGVCLTIRYNSHKNSMHITTQKQ